MNEPENTRIVESTYQNWINTQVLYSKQSKSYFDIMKNATLPDNGAVLAIELTTLQNNAIIEKWGFSVVSMDPAGAYGIEIGLSFFGLLLNSLMLNNSFVEGLRVKHPINTIPVGTVAAGSEYLSVFSELQLKHVQIPLKQQTTVSHHIENIGLVIDPAPQIFVRVVGRYLNL